MDAIAEKQELLIEIETRRKKNPLKYHRLLPLQEQFKQDESITKCLFGGNRSGKSEGGADEVCDYALSNPNSRIWCCGETFQDSIAIQQRKIFNLMPRSRVMYGNYDPINGYTNRKLLIDNGTLITFKSYDQGTKVFQSDDIDYIWNDEEPPIDIYKEQRMRLIDRNGRMIITMTSLKGVTELIEDIFEDHEVIESQYAELVDEELPRIAEKGEVRFYFLWTLENKHINQERTLKEAKLLTDQEIKQRIYGIPINLSGRIYPKFNRNIHVISWDDIPEGKFSLYNVLDPHDRKPWAIAWFAVYKTGSCYLVEEYPEKNFNDMLFDDKTYDDYAKVIKAKTKELEGLFNCKCHKKIIDPNFGNKTIQLAERQGGQSRTTPRKELAKRGLHYTDGIDALEAGHLKVREYLHWDKKGDELVVQPKLFIVDTCHNSIRHLSRYSRKDVVTPDGDVKDKVGVKEKYKDYCFVAGTNVRMADGTQKPIEMIKVGDMVQTDVGARKVTKADSTRHAETIKSIFSDGRELISTLDHHIYLVNGKAIRADSLRKGHFVSIWVDQKHMIGRSGIADIIRLVQDFSIEKFGKRIMVQFRKVWMFIIKMGINLITILKTLRYWIGKVILRNIHKLKNDEGKYHYNYKKEQSGRTKCLHGINLMKEENGHQVISEDYLKNEHQINENVFNVQKNMKQRQYLKQNSVQTIVNQHIEDHKGKILKQDDVVSVAESILQTNTQKQKHVQENVLEFLKAEQSGKKTVYNITVEDRHRYYANDILVANCDLVRYFVMSDPKYIVKRKEQELRKVY